MLKPNPMEEVKGKYIYCVIRKPSSFDFDLPGVGGEKIHLVISGRLAAVVNDSEIEDYPITRENTLTHQKVIEEVMRLYPPVLPVSFGTIAEDSSIIQKILLEEKQNELLKAFLDIEGRIELNLKAIWLDMPKILQKIVLENPELKRLKDTFRGKVVGRDTAIEIGRLVVNGIELRREKIKNEILSLLEDIFVDYKETALFGDEMIFNFAFLIPENKQNIFDKIVRDLDNTYANEYVYFKYIGPIAPFNFVKIPLTFT